MPRRPGYVPLRFTIPVESQQQNRRRRQALDLADPKIPASVKHRIRHYGYRKLTEDEMDDRPRVTQHKARERSIIDLVWCSVCRQYQLEGSKALGYCRTCGTVNA
ncbi:MAG: hypothetical protein HOQ34_03815 [Gemmatimonadaceae bacterium]|nr:hypothetical protein [Gemmatimonadaceae bacterium]